MKTIQNDTVTKFINLIMLSLKAVIAQDEECAHLTRVVERNRVPYVTTIINVVSGGSPYMESLFYKLLQVIQYISRWKYESPRIVSFPSRRNLAYTSTRQVHIDKPRLPYTYNGHKIGRFIQIIDYNHEEQCMHYIETWMNLEDMYADTDSDSSENGEQLL